MKYFASIFAVSILFLGLLSTGCSDSTSPEIPGVVKQSLTTRKVADPLGSFLVAEVSVVNNTRSDIHYPPGCPRQLNLQMETEEGESVILQDPTLELVCPPVLQTIHPGETVDTTWNLRWTWDEEGNRFRIPPGTYHLKTMFRFFDSEDDPGQRLEMELTVEIP